MRYSSHRSETAILSTKCRRRIAAFSSGANVRRASFLLIRDPSLLHRVEPEGVTFQLNRNTRKRHGSSQVGSEVVVVQRPWISSSFEERLDYRITTDETGQGEVLRTFVYDLLSESGRVAPGWDLRALLAGFSTSDWNCSHAVRPPGRQNFHCARPGPLPFYPPETRFVKLMQDILGPIFSTHEGSNL